MFENNKWISGLSGYSISLGVAVLTTAIFYKRKYDSFNNQMLPNMITHDFSEFVSYFIRGQVHRFHLILMKESGSIYRIYRPFTTSNVIIVHDPTVARIIMEGDAANNIPESEKSIRYKFVEKLTMNVSTMLTKYTFGKEWKDTRKAVAPAFSVTNLYKTLPALQVKIEQFKQILEDHIMQNKPLEDLPSWMIRITIDFLSTSMFHTDYHTLEVIRNQQGQVVETEGMAFIRSLTCVTKEYMMKAPLKPWRKYTWWNREIMAEVIAADNAAKEVAAIGKKVLDDYRNNHTEEEIKNDTSIIGHLIRSPYPTETLRVADISTFMIAGHDTSGYQLAWIIIELSKHPRIVSKLREELDEIFPKSTPSSSVVFTPQHLSKLNYLNMVIKEGMRLWPVAAVGTSRVVAADIPYGDKVIPKGTLASIGFFGMFRSGIREPHDFIPERWLDDDVDATMLKSMSFPFSLGTMRKRACVGQSLALLELKLVLSNLFYFYDFHLISTVTENYYLTLKPNNADFTLSKRVC